MRLLLLFLFLQGCAMVSSESWEKCEATCSKNGGVDWCRQTTGWGKVVRCKDGAEFGQWGAKK